MTGQDKSRSKARQGKGTKEHEMNGRADENDCEEWLNDSRRNERKGDHL